MKKDGIFDLHDQLLVICTGKKADVLENCTAYDVKTATNRGVNHAIEWDDESQLPSDIKRVIDGKHPDFNISKNLGNLTGIKIDKSADAEKLSVKIGFNKVATIIRPTYGGWDVPARTHCRVGDDRVLECKAKKFKTTLTSQGDLLSEPVNEW